MKTLPPFAISESSPVVLSPSGSSVPIRGYLIYNASPLILTVLSGSQTFYLASGAQVFVKASESTGDVTIVAIASTNTQTDGTIYVTSVFLQDSVPSILLSSTNNVSVSGGTLNTYIVGSDAILDVSGSNVNTNVTNTSTKLSLDIADSVAPSDTPVISNSNFAIGFTPILSNISTDININTATFIQTSTTVTGQVGLSTTANTSGLFLIGNATANNPFPPLNKGIVIPSGSTIYFYCSAALTGILSFLYTTL